MGVIDVIVMILFMVSVIGVGLYKSKGSAKPGGGEETAEDYFLAGRGLSWWLIGFSLIAANISAEQFVGMSGQGAGLEGLSVSSWEWIAAVTLVVVAFVLLPYFLRTGITTIPEFLEVRYNHWARLVMTVSMTFILVGVSLVGVIYAGALTMTELMAFFGTELSLSACCWALGAMAAIYVAVGGLKACAWADLLMGSALIVGGGIITYYAFHALGMADVNTLVDSTGGKTLVDQNATALEKFNTLNSKALHMDSPAMPWPVLLLGIWIPNFYYWGLNQYITQRILGSASLPDGQKGLVFAGFLKLIIPFVIVIPGIIAFNLYSTEMNESAIKDNYLKKYEIAVQDPNSKVVFSIDPKWEVTHAEKANEIKAYNASVEARVGKENTVADSIKGYKYDTALGFLITRLIPHNSGILGFILAALLGAIVSSLAAVLNAASTLFTMDVYQRYLNKKATQKTIVACGRMGIGVFVVIGCVVAPLLKEAEGVFAFIQSFQGYVSTGILAVFIYGLLNRTSGEWAGVIGIAANACLYHFFNVNYPSMHFLYSMSYSLLIVLGILFVYGLLHKAEKPVVFRDIATMDMSTSKGALVAGILVCIITVTLYVVFW
jgi:solute:Na+ symporter, SSS family